MLETINDMMFFYKLHSGKTYTESELLDSDFLKKLIKFRCDFSIKTEDINRIVGLIEMAIENNGFTCRVYTENRAAAMGASLFSGIGSLIGIGSAIAIAAHNIATFNPDFEIGKNLLDKKVNVTYKK